MRICNCCDRIIKRSTYTATHSQRLSDTDNIGITIHVHVNGITDVCDECIGVAAMEASETAAKILGNLEDEREPINER
jgi:hypothetical protein